MPEGCKVVVVMPAFNASKTLERTVSEIPPGSVDEIILCDDGSSDDTVEIARRLGLRVLTHRQNRGYGANQKTCYGAALDSGADIVVMVHPDHQYDPRVIPLAVGFIRLGICDVIVASRIRARGEALDGGMPIYKYIANRVLTIVENVVLGQNLGDFHSGFRVYKRAVLEALAYHSNSDDFVFDTELLAQAVYHGFRIADVPIPARYSPEASSIDFRRSVTYGLGTLRVMGQYLLHCSRLARVNLFARSDRAQR